MVMSYGYGTKSLLFGIEDDNESDDELLSMIDIACEINCMEGGRDKVGIIATVSAACSGFGVNIVDISQTVLDGYFAMIMLVEIGGMKESSFLEFSAALKKIGEENAVDIRVMHEDIFNSMHRI